MGDVDYPDYEYGCDVNPICGCHIRSRCPSCTGCTGCDACYCGED